MTDSLPVAFVVQRYGVEVDGGAELHCRWIAERLVDRFTVEIITTCARDYVTWKNDYEPGTSVLNGVTVHRFSSTRERDRTPFDALTARLLSNPHALEAEKEWIDQQGPYCPALLEYLQKAKDHYRAIIFYTYLYYPTALGLPLVAEKSILVPTAHDEPVIRFAIYQELFTAPRALLFLTDAERLFVHKTFRNESIPWRLLGTGIELTAGTEQEFRSAFKIAQPYLLYTGRIDAGKGCLELCHYFIASKEKNPSPLKLVFLGKLHDQLPDHQDIHYLGFLNEDLKAGAVRGALALVASSPFESLGISALEALAVGTPILVNGRCRVLVDHCREGNAGLWYLNQEEFSEIVKELLRNENLRKQLSAQAQRYVAERYTWAGVLATLTEVITAV